VGVGYTDNRYDCVSKKGQSWDRAIFQKDRGLYRLKKKVLDESTSLLLPLASTTSSAEWYAKPLRAAEH
jgi:hypothetical protein